MKAWLLDNFEGLSNLRPGEAPDPKPAEGEVVLRVEYAALNPADRYEAEGMYPARPPLPHILGRDGVGTVTEIGAGVEGLQVGDRRAILRGETGVMRPGTFAEYVSVAADSLVEIPAGWTHEQAAGAALVYLTAYQALTQWGESKPLVVLITGASGGVGVASTQLGSALGHTVAGLSRSEEKRQRLLTLGASIVLDPVDPHWRHQLKNRLRGRRVDLAIDNIGGDLLPKVIDTLGMFGKISVVGRLAGPVPEFNTSALLFRRLKIGGVAVGTYTCGESHSAWSEIVSLMGNIGARPIVDRVFAFDQLPGAFARLERGPMGKVLLKVAE